MELRPAGLKPAGTGRSRTYQLTAKAERGRQTGPRSIKSLHLTKVFDGDRAQPGEHNLFGDCAAEPFQPGSEFQPAQSSLVINLQGDQRMRLPH